MDIDIMDSTNSDDELPEWCKVGFDIDIRDAERNTLSASAISALSKAEMPDLKGRSPDEVKQEASRIRLGERFTCFQDFDRCLDSWCFLNGRSAARLKTKKTHCVRVCRFGDTVRPAWRTKLRNKTLPTSQDAEFQGELAALSGDVRDCGDCASADDLGSQQKGSHGGQTEPGVFAVDASQHKENCVPQQPTQQHSEEEERSGNHNHQSLTPMLADLLPTTTGACPMTTPQKSQMKHTGGWLPASFVHSPGTAAKKGPRKLSRTGACGEQSRLLPPPSEDDEKGQPCPFRVRCQREKRTGKLHITVCELQHTCPQSKHEWRGPSRKSQWLGETLAPRVLSGSKVPVNEMINGMQTDYKISTTYHQMFRARELVRDWHLGRQRKSFHRIPALCERLKKTDPESIVNCSEIVDSKSFKRTFICPSTTRHALKHCQPVVSVYARHTKNKKYPAQLFFATSRDRDSSVVALCFAVAPAENAENWTWFLQMLQASIHGIDSPNVPLIFDRQKGGQLAAVLEVFPGKVHRRSAFPLCADVRMGYGRAAAAFFLNRVYAESSKLFKDLLGRLATSTAKGAAAAAVQDIWDIDPKLYARRAFPLPRHSNVTSNLAKQSKSRLRLLSLFAHPKVMMEMWYQIQKKLKDTRTELVASQKPFTEEAPHQHAVNQQTYGQWQILDDGHCQAKLQTTEPAEELQVNLSPKTTCSSLEVQEMLWPCEHVMAWDSGLVVTLPTPQGLERQSNTTRKRKSIDGARTGRTKCSNCNELGHNIRTCSRVTRVTDAAQQSTERSDWITTLGRS